MWCDALRPDTSGDAGPKPDAPAPNAWTAAPASALLFCGWALPVDETRPGKTKHAPKRRAA